MEYLLTIELNKEGMEEYLRDTLEFMCSRPHGINMGCLFYEVDGVQHGMPIRYIKDFYFVTEKMNEVSQSLVKTCTDPNCPVHNNK